METDTKNGLRWKTIKKYKIIFSYIFKSDVFNHVVYKLSYFYFILPLLNIFYSISYISCS